MNYVLVNDDLKAYFLILGTSSAIVIVNSISNRDIIDKQANHILFSFETFIIFTIIATLLLILCFYVTSKHKMKNDNRFGREIIFYPLLIFCALFIFWSLFFFSSSENKGIAEIMALCLLIGTLWIMWIFYHLYSRLFILLIIIAIWSIYLLIITIRI